MCLHFESGLCFLFVLVSDVTVHSEREKFILYCNCIFLGVSDGLIHLIFNLIWPKGFPKVCHCPLRLKNHFNWLKFCFHCIFIQLNCNKSILEVSIKAISDFGTCFQPSLNWKLDFQNNNWRDRSFGHYFKFSMVFSANCIVTSLFLWG